jgi:hypothetical protein
LGRMRRGHSTGTEGALTTGLPGQRDGFPTARPSAWRLLFPLVAAVSLLALGACSDGNDRQASANESDDSNNTTTTAETSTTLSAREQEEQAVSQATQAAEQARADSSAATPNPDLPALADTHTGLMLDQWKNTTSVLRYNGFAIRVPPNSQSRTDVISVSFDDVEGRQVAIAEVCYVDDSERYVVATGQVLDSGVRTVQVTEAYEKVDGVWKLAERDEHDRWEGVAGCAAGG